MHQHKNYFGVGLRFVFAEKFDINLIKLTETSFLRSFTAEHRTNREKLGYLLVGGHIVFNIGTDDGGGGFRPQG